jgi:hypothetical protein
VAEPAVGMSELLRASLYCSSTRVSSQSFSEALGLSLGGLLTLALDGLACAADGDRDGQVPCAGGDGPFRRAYHALGLPQLCERKGVHGAPRMETVSGIQVRVMLAQQDDDGGYGDWRNRFMEDAGLKETHVPHTEDGRPLEVRSLRYCACDGDHFNYSPDGGGQCAMFNGLIMILP